MAKNMKIHIIPVHLSQLLEFKEPTMLGCSLECLPPLFMGWHGLLGSMPKMLTMLSFRLGGLGESLEFKPLENLLF
jgi:hypothetical protein